MGRFSTGQKIDLYPDTLPVCPFLMWDNYNKKIRKVGNIMTNLEKLYLDMEGISEVELGTKKVYAKVISDNLKSINERHLDLLHYIIGDKSIKGIEGITYKATDLFSLKEYLLDLLHCEKVQTISSIEEELWLNLTLDELKFIAQAIYILKNNEDLARNLLKNIRRGLVKYPFDRVYMY